MMRDESCGDTIQRLLDGLEDLLRSRRLGVDGDGDAWSSESDDASRGVPRDTVGIKAIGWGG